MQRHYRTATLAGGLVAGLITLVQYRPLALRIPQLAASGGLIVNDGLWLRDWVGPSLTIPTVTLAVGLVAGWLAAREAGRPAYAGARAGAAAGGGALLVLTIIFAALLAWVCRDPAVQELVRLSEPHPEARLAPEAIPWLGAGVGALLGLTVGAQSFATALFGGVLADLLAGRGGRHAQRPA